MHDRVLVEEFLATEEGSKLGQFFKWLYKEAKAQNWKFIVFMARRGYWLFLIISAYYELKWDGIKCYSDRYARKEYDSALQNASIVLVDDAISTGNTLFRMYFQLHTWYPNAQILPIVAGVGTGRLMEDILIHEGSEEEEKCFRDFRDKIGNFYKMTPEGMGELSYNVSKLIQNLMIPYVIDLPFMVDKSFDTEQGYLADLNSQGSACDRKSTIRKDRWEEFQAGNDVWKYIENSYDISGDGEYIYTGFFIYKGRELDVLNGFLLAPIIKCRYEMVDDEVRAVFTPFAILKTIRYDLAWNLFETLFQGDEMRDYYTETKQAKDSNGAVYKGLYTAVYRGIVYFFSRYLGVLFNDYLAAFDVGIKQDLILLEYNSSKAFIEAAKKIDSFKKENFIEIIEQIFIPYGVEPAIEFNRESNVPLATLMSRTYRTLYVEMIRRKRDKAFRSEVTFTLEDAMDLLAVSHEYPSYQCMKECLVGAVLRMLDTSVMGNVLQYRSGKIFRGFHYGENSDVMIPYCNRYVLSAIEQFYWRLREEFSLGRESVFEGYFHNFWDDLYTFLYEKYYLNTIIDPLDYKQLRQHYDVTWHDLGKLIRRLHFMIKSMKQDDVYVTIQKYVLNYRWS